MPHAIPSSPTSSVTAPGAFAVFDYNALGTNEAADLRAAATTIRGRMAASVIETGRDLLAIRERLEYGQFEAWVEAECLITPRTAQNMMAAARWAEGKSETVSLLPPTVIYRLSAPSTPEDTRRDLLRRIEAGEKVSATDAKQIISNARYAARKAARLQTKKPLTAEQIAAANKREARERKRLERVERERQAEEERRKLAFDDLMKFLTERIPHDDWLLFRSLLKEAGSSVYGIGQLFRDEESATRLAPPLAAE